MQEIYEKPAMIDEEEGCEFYKVEKLLDWKLVRGKRMYLVKWVGWPIDYATWEPHSNVRHLGMLGRRLSTPRKRKDKHPTLNLDRLTPGNDPFEKTSQIGHFLYGDTPVRIVRTVKVNQEDKPVIEVQWGRREDGSIPSNSFFTIQEATEYAPQFLLEELENMIVLQPI